MTITFFFFFVHTKKILEAQKATDEARAGLTLPYLLPKKVKATLKIRCKPSPSVHVLACITHLQETTVSMD